MIGGGEGGSRKKGFALFRFQWGHGRDVCQQQVISDIQPLRFNQCLLRLEVVEWYEQLGL